MNSPKFDILICDLMEKCMPLLYSLVMDRLKKLEICIVRKK